MEEKTNGLSIFTDSSIESAMINEYITYSIYLKNLSDEDIKECFISINVPEDTEYMDNSLICSETYEISNEASGIIIKNIEANSSCNIFYKVEVIKVPLNGAVVNRNFIKYFNNEGEVIRGASNSISTRIKGALIKSMDGFKKSIVEGQLKVGEIITFEIIIKNTGNLTAFDLFLTDILPENIEPLLDKVIINNRILTLNTLKDLSLGNLGPFKSIIIRYKSIVTGITNEEGVFSLCKLKYRYFNDFINDYIDSESIGNEVSLDVREAIIEEKRDFSCVLEKSDYLVQEEGKAYFTILNRGNEVSKNTILEIKLDSGVLIKDNIVKINDKEAIISSVNKILIGEIKPKEKVKIEFFIIGETISEGEKFLAGELSYDYEDLELGTMVNKKSKSNVETFNIIGSIINDNCAVIEKKINKSICKIGEEVEHSFSINNKGNIKCEGLSFKELDSYGHEFVKGSLRINGVYKNIDFNRAEINLGDILPGETLDITYKSKITDIPMEEVVRSRAYVEFYDRGEKNRIWCSENSISVVGINITYELNIENFYDAKEHKQSIMLFIQNIGNRRADEVKLDFTHSNGVKILKILKGEEEVKGISLEPGESLELKLIFEIDKDKIKENIYILGNIDYIYDIDENNLGQGSKVIEKENIKVLWDNLNMDYQCSVLAIEEEEEFALNFVLSNEGNMELTNIYLENILVDGLKLLYSSDRIYNNIMKLGSLKIGEEKIITLVVKGKREFSDNEINIKPIINYEYYKDKLVKVREEGKVFTLEYLNSHVDMEMNIINEEILEDELVEVILKVHNFGLYTFEKSKLSLVSNNTQIIDFNRSLIINGKLEEFDLDTQCIEIGNIEPNETLIIKVPLKVKGPKSLKLYGIIKGYYKFNSIEEYREKSFYSNEINLKVQKICLNTFLSADKELLYKGDKVKYSSVIINNGTIPLEFNYEMNVSKSLIPEKNGLIVNGVIFEDDEEYKSTIDPGEGIIIEKIYLYNNSFGGNKVFGEAIINYINASKLGGNKEKGEIKSSRIFIDASSTTFKELIIDHKEALIDFEEELMSVSNVYAIPEILNYYVVDKFKNIGTDNEIVASTKVIVRGILNLKIEYISKSENIYIHSKHLDFVTFMILPREFKDGDKLNISVTLEDIYYRIIDLSYLFLNINLLVKALF